MRFKDAHITYCQSIHPASSLDEALFAIKKYAVHVKRRISPDEPFGLGFRFSAAAIFELEKRGAGDLKRILDETGMYAFTMNCFPYGEFHGGPVKENVYVPDWSDKKRLIYTFVSAKILAELLPKGISGSISTMPVAYGKKMPAGAIENIAECANRLKNLFEKTGREIILAFEPEPDCFLETASEAVAFRKILSERVNPEAMRFIGVCLDTCHHAVIFRNPAKELALLEKAGVPVPKIQVTSAIKYNNSGLVQKALYQFRDAVYLHQTRVKTPSGISGFRDLPEALEINPRGEWRIHYHVPLGAELPEGIGTAETLLTPAFFKRALAPGRHIEMETYTFNMLPGKKLSAVDSICSEYKRLLSRLSKAP